MRDLYNSLKYYKKTISLPMYVGLKKEDIKYISNSLIKIIHG